MLLHFTFVTFYESPIKCQITYFGGIQYLQYCIATILHQCHVRLFVNKRLSVSQETAHFCDMQACGPFGVELKQT